jgi:hypothetical protein
MAASICENGLGHKHSGEIFIPLVNGEWLVERINASASYLGRPYWGEVRCIGKRSGRQECVTCRTHTKEINHETEWRQVAVLSQSQDEI